MMESVDRLIEKTVAKLGLKKSADQWKAVQLWPKIVGKNLAKLSRPLYVSDGVLYVGTTSSSWANELDMMKPEFLSKIREHLGNNAIRDVRFYSSMRKEENDPQARPKKIELDQKEREFVENISNEIQSSALKEAFQKFLSGWLVSQKKAKDFPDAVKFDVPWDSAKR